MVFTIPSLIRRHGTGSSFCLRSMLSAGPAIARTQTRSSPAICSMTGATGSARATRRRTDSDGAIMSCRPSCKVANTRRDPSPGRQRWRSSDGSQQPCAQPRPPSIGRVDLSCTGRSPAAAARQPILQRCARATTMQTYAPPSSASSSLERRSRSSLPRGWRVTIRIAS